jgi:uncharacterized protein
MKFSKYNILSKVRDSDKFFIVNHLSGNADILTPEEAFTLKEIQWGAIPTETPFYTEMVEKGYFVDTIAEADLYRQKYLEFLDARDNDEIQLFFVPNYSCNFSCTYCYQDQYSNLNQELDFKIVDAFFSYIQTEFADRKKYITVFGGEPLLSSPKQKEMIVYLLNKANSAKLDVCFVTNGYTLIDYIEILRLGRIREVQVTLDGTEEVHNKRRFLKGGAGSFEKIVKGIDLCLENKITVNLRMVIDKENIDDLPGFSAFAINKGWTKSPYFKSQIGRNYELHHCQSSPDKLFDRVSLYEAIFELIRQHPHIPEFYKPAYSITKFLSENGELPEPLFDSCPACKTEWAFDYTGHIFPCTATVGKADESLGTFYPKVTRKNELIEEWEMRDVTAIHDCKDCSVQLACGGGCGSVAKNASGKICSTDCRPVKALLELGFAAYFENDIA